MFPFPEHEGVTNLWNNVILPLLDQFVSIIEQAAQDIIILFNDKDDVTFGQALSRLSYNLISGLVELVKRLVNGLLELAKEMLASLKSVMNKRLDNALLNLITGGDGLTVMDIAGWIMAPFVHLGYVAMTGDGMPEDNPVPNFAAAASGSQTTEAEAPRMKRKAAKTGEEPEEYVNESQVSEADQRFDLAAGIIEGVVRIVGTIEAFVGAIGADKFTSAGGTNRARRLPLNDSHAQLYKFSSPDPLTHYIVLSTDDASLALTGASSARAASTEFPGKAAVPWIGTIFKAVGVVITYPEWHPPHSEGRERCRKISAWVFSLFDLIGGIAMKAYEKVKDEKVNEYGEAGFSMLMSVCGFIPSMMAAVLDFKEAKKEKEEWPEEDTPETKKRMASARLSLVIVDGIGAIANGVLTAKAGTAAVVAAGVIVVTTAAGIAIVETTVARCWQTRSKNYFVCVL